MTKIYFEIVGWAIAMGFLVGMFLPAAISKNSDFLVITGFLILMCIPWFIIKRVVKILKNIKG